MQWSPIQDRALSAVADWIQNPHGRPVFRLFGHAGTGKTTLALHLAATVGGQVLFAAYTGKAAHVMQQRGCHGASTIHSLIYKPSEKSKETLRELQEEFREARLEIIRDSGGAEGSPEAEAALSASHLLRRLQQDIDVERNHLKRPAFSLNLDSELRDAKMLIVDECSMVNEEMATDLLSFETPILVLGDPAQLPPVRGSGYFTNEEPDVLLTEIHRQARDNPIIQMATAVREGEKLELGEYGESRVIGMDEGEPGMYTAHDQVLCGREKKPENWPDPVWRSNLNRRIREILGRTHHMPVTGDKLVCLRNNHEVGLLNGGQWHVVTAVDGGDKVNMVLKGEDGQDLTVDAHSRIFRGEEVDFWDMKSAEHFDYGYTMTVHKAQGSQWPSVLIFDQSRIFRQDARRWLYTAITRASERVTVIRA